MNTKERETLCVVCVIRLVARFARTSDMWKEKVIVGSWYFTIVFHFERERNKMKWMFR